MPAIRLYLEDATNLVLNDLKAGNGAYKTFLKRYDIIKYEDNAELRIMGVANLVRMEARNANLEGVGAIPIRELIRAALRMRPEPHHYEIVRLRA